MTEKDTQSKPENPISDKQNDYSGTSPRKRGSSLLDENLDQTGHPPARVHTPDVKEIGGQAGPEPTRYGDWEKGGRCTDF